MVHRKLYFRLLTHLDKKEFSIITGARQTGKSTLLRQLEMNCKEQEIPAIFINLENKLLVADLNQSPLNLLRYLPETEKRIVVLIDEVQYLEDPSNFLKLLYDEYAGKIKIVATGSSAFYIDTRFRDSLAGRKRLFHLHTCSFDEYLAIAGEEVLLEEFKVIGSQPGYKSLKIDLLRMEWEKYMIYGGYPAVAAEKDANEKVALLKEIRDSFIKRDVIESGVQNEMAFYKLFRVLATQTGNLVNVNELAATLQIKNETVVSYLNIMQKCFHIALIRPYFKNLRKELTKMQKVYIPDSGLRNCLLNNFQYITERADRGELWENVVFRLIVENNEVDEIHFWRTSAGNEVDFVLPAHQIPLAVEAKLNASLISKSKYKLFTETYPGLPLKFLVLNPVDENFFRNLP
jgi:predicted AAA+ superfamily ATPase